MSRRRRPWALGALLVSVAVLLPAGVLSLTTLEPSTSTVILADGRVALAGVDQAGLVEELPTTTVAPRPTTTVAPTTTSSPPTTAAPAVRTTLPPPVTVPSPTVAPATTWQAEHAGVSVRVRMDPAAPVAGQPVRLLLDVSSAEVCCTVLLEFGDGSERFTWNNEPRHCNDPSPLVPGPRSTVATHTYAAAGAYRASVGVFSGDLCKPGPIGGPSPVHVVTLPACIVVGPRSAGAGGCTP